MRFVEFVKRNQYTRRGSCSEAYVALRMTQRRDDPNHLMTYYFSLNTAAIKMIGESFVRVKLFADCNDNGKIEGIGFQFLKEGTDRAAASKYIRPKNRPEARISATAFVVKYNLDEALKVADTEKLLLLPDTDEGLENFYVALIAKP
jgi:hypothetical protein